MSQQSDYGRLSDRLAAALDLRQAPVAISFTNSVPDGVKRHDERVPAGCRFWQDGASAAFVTAAVDHDLCSIGVYTHNLQSSPASQTDLSDALKVFADLDYVRPADLASIPVLASQPGYIVYAPLAVSPLPPDVVLLFVNASQTLILSEATQQVENQNAPAMGRPACGVVPQVMNSGKAALSLGCCGARAYLDVLTDEVAVFAIPGATLEAYAARIDALSRANQTLAQFHQIRRRTVAAGQAPSVKESLALMQ
jgi:uncharacterized protein (DUF169 family)